MPDHSTKRRIAELDGLRTVAILGVLFAHVWAFGCGSPPLYIGRIDINRFLSIFGTGVDLFFVISGFCMYMMYAAKTPEFSWSSYRDFLASRARRIIPAYLAAMLFAAGVWVASHGWFPLREVIAHLFFVQILVPGAGKLASPFWSLATEWHFYLVLPGLIVAARRFGYRHAVLVAVLGSIAFRAFVAPYEGTAVPLESQLPARLVEFALGIAVARAHLSGYPLPRSLAGARGVGIGFLVMFAGRLLMTDQVVHMAMPIRVMAAALNVPILSLGYALIVWSVVASESIVASALRSAPAQRLGRWSYSFYLWHWFPGIWIGDAMVKRFGFAGWIPLTATLLATLVVIPIAALSFSLFEAPYFGSRAPKQGAARDATNL
jgi:peptidoglycan/LPS O-acetylase OafA/YrhL